MQAALTASTVVQLTWSGSANATAYEVWYRPLGGGWQTYIANSAQAVISGLQQGAQYEFKVKSICDGPDSEFSQTTSITVDVGSCNAPVNASSNSVTTNSANLSWSGSADALSFEVVVNGQSYTTSSPTYALSGLTASTTYNVQIYANCGLNSSDNFASVSFTTLDEVVIPEPEECDAPVNLQVMEISHNDASLQWDPVPGASSYMFRYHLGNSNEPWEEFPTQVPNVYVSGLDPETLYDAQVITYCSNGMESLWGAVIEFETPVDNSVDCYAPLNLSSLVGTNSAEISWTGPADASSYSVSYGVSGGNIANTNSNSTEVNLNNLQSNTTYFVHVTANCGGQNSDASDNYFFTTEEEFVCLGPTEIDTEEQQPSQVLVSWQQSNADSYIVEYKLASSSNWLEAPGSAVVGSSLLLSLDYESDYHLRIRGLCNGFGESPNSAIYAFSTSSEPVVPESCDGFLSVQTGSATADGIDVSWTPFGSFDTYVLEYKIEGGSNWESIPVGAATNYFLGGLNASTTYLVRVVPSCDNGVQGQTSIALQFTTTEEEDPVEPPTPCAAPDNVEASSITENSALLTWDHVDGGLDYQLRFKEIDSPYWNYSSATTSNSVLLEQLNGDTTYEVEVIADCGELASDFSLTFQFTTLPETLPCETPTNVQISAMETSLTFSWAEVPGALSYTIRYRVVGAAQWIPVSNIVENTYEIEGLQPATAYQYQLRAICVDGPTQFTMIDAAETAAPPVIPCAIATMLMVGQISETGANISWSASSNAISYDVVVTDIATGDGETYQAITGTNYEVSGLSPDTQYSVVIQSNCAQGQSGPSQLVTFTTDATPLVCDEVVELDVSQVTETSALVNWENTATASSYDVLVENLAGGQDKMFEDLAAGSLLVPGLQPGTEYSVTLIANCANGLSSSSNPIEFVTEIEEVPDCPVVSGLHVLNSDMNSALVGWNAAAGAVSYKVAVRILGGTWGSPETTSSNTMQLDGLQAGESYQFRVKAICSQNQSQYSTPHGFQTEEQFICMSVGAMQIQTMSETAIQVQWAPIAGAVKYDLAFRQLGQLNWTSEVNITSNSHLLTDLAPGTTYEVKVKTYCLEGVSEFSEIFTGDTSTPGCGVVQGVTVNNPGTTTAAVFWDPVDGADQYEIRILNLSTMAPQFQVSFSPFLNLQALMPGVDWQLTVVAVCAGTEAPASEPVLFTTDEIITESCDAPTGLQVVNSGGPAPVQQIEASWQGSAESYQLYHRLLGQVWDQPITVSGNSHVFNWQAGSVHQVRVVAVCGTQVSPTSEVIPFTVPDYQEPSGCPAPTQLSYTFVNENFVSFTWQSTASGPFEIGFLASTPGANWESFATNTPSYITGDLESCTTYAVRVRLKCENGLMSDFASVEFGTAGCEDNYCSSSANNSGWVWIESFNLETINNVSGDNGGYGDFTGMSTSLIAGQAYTITVLPGLQDEEFDQQYSAWIDFNGNGQFEQSTETLFHTEVNPPNGSTSIPEVDLTFVVPEEVAEGETRLRMSAMFYGEPGACQNFDFGEVEDYTVTLVSSGKSGALRTADQEAFVPDIYPNPTQDFVNVEFTTNEASEAVIEVFSTDGKLMSRDVTEVIAGNNHFKVDMASWISSCYWVKVTMNEKVYTKRIMLVK